MASARGIIRAGRLLMLTLFLSASVLYAQTDVSQTDGPKIEVPIEDGASSSRPNSTPGPLPDSPGATQTTHLQQQNVVTIAQASFKVTGDGVAPCNFFNAMKVVYYNPSRPEDARKPCVELIYPYQRFLTSDVIIPLTWQQKGYLGLHDLTDPANFGTILGISAVSIGSDAHTAYGPGLKGFGKIVGVSLLQDATGQFFGVFAVPAIAHQDPRYFRMPQASIRRRIFYSISRTVVSRSDTGATIPNYATILTYPIATELANLYVPGIHPDAASTTTRILTGYATDPVNNLLNEFLPDVASRIHVRVIFVQTLLNNIASAPGTISPP